ncbi:conserved hypothetical protein [Coccidioides posadasii str. Silveira]|uniref:Uncharacterized protein n=1 Tax=Coccidioides posadasii (strain RMSCC 757 / Silveira) TaxID=443226 RepID=E9DEB8_COCPS|nr:conserved hypothetical protein [Coccidioides posadasii str. Silveira]
MNKTHAKAMLGLTVKKLLDLKKIMQELYNKKIQSLIYQVVAKRVLKKNWITVIWESKSNYKNICGMLVWLFVQVQYQKTR